MAFSLSLGNWLRRWYLLMLVVVLLPITRNRVAPALRSVIWSDAQGYYEYLPAFFNLHNVRAMPLAASPQQSASLALSTSPPTINKYTCGAALFQLPFFLIARWWADTHAIARTDVFAPPYSWAVAAAGFIAGMLGLFFLQAALRNQGFSEVVVALTLLITFGGTNLFHYATREMGMSHVYSFCLMAALVWHLPRFFRKPSMSRSALLGGILGWLVLLRPTAVLVLPFVGLFDIYTWPALRQRLRFFSQILPQIALATAVGFLFLLPQLFYWHTETGHWINYSYGHETFIYWKQPHLLAIWFDTQNGLFLYSPLVLLSIFGLWLGWQLREGHAPALTLVFLAASYVFASWWAWWFGGAFGHRCFVEYYALLALPLALVVRRLLALQRRGVKTTFICAIVFLIFCSVQLSFVYTRTSPWDGPEWRWNPAKVRWLGSKLFHF